MFFKDCSARRSSRSLLLLALVQAALPAIASVALYAQGSKTPTGTAPNLERAKGGTGQLPASRANGHNGAGGR